MSTRTPQSIAAHITTALIPAITTTAGQLGRHPGNLITRLQGCAINLANVDLVAIAASLGREHHTAAAGRPRQGAGGNTGGIGTSTTEDISCELDRISRYWLDLTETIDRLHPHPDWPPITSGLRARLTTATEALIAVCVPLRATQDPQVAWEDLTDAVEGVQVATAAVIHAARRASRAHRPPRPQRRHPPRRPLPRLLRQTLPSVFQPTTTHARRPRMHGLRNPQPTHPTRKLNTTWRTTLQN